MVKQKWGYPAKISNKRKKKLESADWFIAFRSSNLDMRVAFNFSNQSISKLSIYLFSFLFIWEIFYQQLSIINIFKLLVFFIFFLLRLEGFLPIKIADFSPPFLPKVWKFFFTRWYFSFLSANRWGLKVLT